MQRLGIWYTSDYVKFKVLHKAVCGVVRFFLMEGFLSSRVLFLCDVRFSLLYFFLVWGYASLFSIKFVHRIDIIYSKTNIGFLQKISRKFQEILLFSLNFGGWIGLWQFIIKLLRNPERTILLGNTDVTWFWKFFLLIV